MDCDKRVVDLFASREYNSSDSPDEWRGAVWSVMVETVNNVPSAIVLNDSTTWIMTSHRDLSLDLDVGDVVRIGTLQTSGYTDYITVLEKKEVRQITSGMIGASATHSLTWAASSLAPIAPLGENPAIIDPTSNLVTYTDLPANTYAYRINKSIDCTTPPDNLWEYRHYSNTGNPSPRALKLLQRRHLIRVSETTNATGDHTRLFPLYRIKQWPKRDLRIVLDNSVRYVHWIKLVGYSIVNQRQVGFQNEHDFQNDDWVALHIDEVDGEVLSNNKAASGAFAVLHAGSDDNASTGAKEFHKYEPRGLVTHTFSSPSNMRQLTMGFLNHAGERASFGRIHLWFKVCVSQG
tara:strand:- start:337 stop:1383 length:1047 start_codon:yes stop_codon:yes gene_type:complete